jgi:glycosyltransferase involved in cell wall biosynthesis
VNKAKILLIIPCYNEEKAIVPLLEEVRALPGDEYEALVIDDGSSDQTYALASKYTRCICLPANLGIGGAVQTGIKVAHREEFDACVQLDGDGQHPAREIVKLVEAWRNTGANLTIGSRYVEHDGFQSSLFRRTGGYFISRLLALLFPGLSISDPTSGMRLMDKKAIRLFSEVYPHDFPEPISIAWAARCGLKVKEVAVTMRHREHGVSSISGLRTVAYMIRGLGYIALARFQKVPLL